jgi:hypothetical protein
MENPNPIARLVIFGKIKRMISDYRSTKIKSIDRRLLRGIFVRNLKEFDEDHLDKMQNLTLVERMINATNYRSGDADLTPESSIDEP